VDTTRVRQLEAKRRETVQEAKRLILQAAHSERTPTSAARRRLYALLLEREAIDADLERAFYSSPDGSA
jgi:hypothetical protein